MTFEKITKENKVYVQYWKWTELLEIQDKPFDYYVSFLREKKPVAIARYGDGEWLCLLKADGYNNNGDLYYADLSGELLSILKAAPEYMIGISPSCFRYPGFGPIKKFLLENEIKREWHDANLFQQANWSGEFFPFVKALRERGEEVLFVVPAFLRSTIKTLFPQSESVLIPSQNVWISRKPILAAIEEKSRPVICLSCGMAANVFLNELYLKDKNRAILNVGSVWDIYAGRISRLHFEPSWTNWPETIRKNLGE